MEAKKKRKVLPYLDIGNRGVFSTDHFILTSHERFSCLTSPPLLVTAGDTPKTSCCGPRKWLSTMLCDHIHALETSESLFEPQLLADRPAVFLRTCYCLYVSVAVVHMFFLVSKMAHFLDEAVILSQLFSCS